MNAPTQEGACDHLATKADLERFRGEFRADMERFRADFARGLLRLGIAIVSAMCVIAGIVLAIVKLT